MTPRIIHVLPLSDYRLSVTFDDGKEIIYDVSKDFDRPGYSALRDDPGLFQRVQLDESRSAVFWNEALYLPSDAICERGEIVATAEDRRNRFIAEPDDFVFDDLVVNGKVVKQQDTAE
ncbi:MAG: DUF2442 domain-containing protein [Clostridia bacterium]|nr:DUF2442 domain-containing protein [Clostridia bacterium]